MKKTPPPLPPGWTYEGGGVWVPPMPSALPPPEPATPSGALALRTCSLPVSSACIDDVALELERQAECAATDTDDTHDETRQWIGTTVYCARVLRRHAQYIRQMEHLTERQPEENTKDEPRREPTQ